MISLSLGQLSVTRSASSFVLSSSLPPSTFPLVSLPVRPLPPPSLSLVRSQPPPHSHQPPQNPEDDDDAQLEDFRVPPHWLLPSNAVQESEWLRVTLHKWLDDEYCPEAANVEISKVAAQSYYTSLLEKQRDLGEILLRMAEELLSISYQESFHGAFSTANAAISLIAQRIGESSQAP